MVSILNTNVHIQILAYTLILHIVYTYTYTNAHTYSRLVTPSIIRVIKVFCVSTEIIIISPSLLVSHLWFKNVPLPMRLWYNETNSLSAVKLHLFFLSGLQCSSIFGKADQKYVSTVMDFLWLREVRERMRHRLVAAEEKRLCTHAAHL